MTERRRVRIDFKDFWHPDTLEHKRSNPLFRLLSKRFDLVVSDDPDFLVYSCFGREHLAYSCTRIFYTGENRRPDFGECDYAFSFDYPETERNFRLPLYALYDSVGRLAKPKDPASILRSKTRFCGFVCSNPSPRSRLEFFERLSRYRSVDSGGSVLNNVGYRVPDKIDFLRQHKFSIAFENASWPGYTTEKLVESMAAETVPIYWGNPLVHLEFNPKSFINCHDYETLDEVIERVVELDQDDDLYQRVLAEPWFPDDVPNEFLREDRILDQFERIFSTPIRPVGATWRNTWARFKYAVWDRAKGHLPESVRARLSRAS